VESCLETSSRASESGSWKERERKRKGSAQVLVEERSEETEKLTSVRNILVVLLSESLVLVVEGIRVVDSGVGVSRKDRRVVSTSAGRVVSSSSSGRRVSSPSDSSSGSVSIPSLESLSLSNLGGVLEIQRRKGKRVSDQSLRNANDEITRRQIKSRTNVSSFSNESLDGSLDLLSDGRLVGLREQRGGRSVSSKRKHRGRGRVKLNSPNQLRG